MKDARFRTHLALALIMLTLAMWLSTGTLAPYGNTINDPYVNPCGYLFNSDHWQFVATFRMLNFDDPANWSFSTMLRRVLYPIMAFPFMKLLGFENGGLLTNFLLHWAAFLAGAAYFRRRFGEEGAIAFVWLLAVFPGITYWVGMPYTHAAIVPACVVSLMLLVEMSREDRTRRIGWLALGVGLSCLAYDLFIFLAPAMLFILWKKERPARFIVPVLAALALPQVAVLLAIALVFKVPPGNSNTAIYGNIIGAYLHPSDFKLWWEMVHDFPWVLVKTYFFANFVFLPLYFLTAYALGRSRGLTLSIVERGILFASALLYVFLNLAPPYLGWQMRGDWISRNYEPMFIAFLLYGIRLAERLAGDARARRTHYALIALCLAGNAITVFGGVFNSRFTSRMYWDFYQHAPLGWMNRNLTQYGVRPWGFCRPMAP